jgi:EthD domain
MIRLVHMLRRAPGLSQQDFAAIWRDANGPLVASFQTDLDIVRYLQLHPDPADQGIDAAAAKARGGMLKPFDGIAEYWWKSADALNAALSSVAGGSAADQMVVSENRFVDLPASPLWLATEFPQVATTLHRPVARIRSSMMRLHFALRPRKELNDAEARRYWLEEHGPLIRSHAPARGLLAYNQVHRCDCPLVSAFSAPRGTTADPFLGHAESWFERPAGERPLPETRAAMDAAIQDERKFIDLSASTILVGKELVFVDREWAL